MCCTVFFGWTACCCKMPRQQAGVLTLASAQHTLQLLSSAAIGVVLERLHACLKHTPRAGLQFSGAWLLAAMAAAGTGCLGLWAVLNGWGRQSAGWAARLISALPLNESGLVCMPLYSLPFLAAIEHVLVGCMHARTTPRAGLQPARPLPMAATAAGWCVKFVISEGRYQLLHSRWQHDRLQLWPYSEGAHLQAAAGISVQLFCFGICWPCLSCLPAWHTMA